MKELIKGKFYRVETDFFMKHDRAEYHSTYKRECDGADLHNMIIRMADDDLGVMCFTDKDIFEQLNDKTEL